jgi:AraC-like DNA-binding protein
MKKSGYTSEVIPVPVIWEDVFSHFYYAVNGQNGDINKTLLPTFQTMLVFSFGNSIHFNPTNNSNGTDVLTIGKSMVIGPLKQAMAYTLSPGSEMLVVNFKWDAFYRFFGKSLKSYVDICAHPGDLPYTHCFAALWEELNELPAATQKIERVLTFSEEYLKEREAAAARIIKNGEGNSYLNPVKRIAGSSQQHERTVQLHYKKYLGYSAKEKSRHERFQKVIRWLQQYDPAADKVDWFEIIHQCGYYDQSHLIHDFTYFLDLSPTQYIALQQHVCIAAG